MQETYICSYGRTPIGGFQGSLSKIPATKLGSIVIESILNNTLLPKDKINEVIMGNVLSANLGQAPSRQAALGAGLLNNVECMTINKVCGSGLKSIMLGDDAIRLNSDKIIIAGGMENMSLAPYYLNNSRTGMMFGDSKVIDSILKDGLWDPYNNQAMGNCAEVLNSDYNFSRKEQDDYAIESYKRANNAIEKGYFKDEIVKVELDSKKGITNIKIDEEPLKFDEGKISQLRPAFNKNGTITAANASSLSDGAAAMLLASKNNIEKYKLNPVAKIVSQASFATEPLYFTKAPIYAIKNVLNKANLDINMIDLFEINEAFSCVPMVAIKELGLDYRKVNIHGGGVSLGHPIGASGARILVTLINALKINKMKYGIATLCIGGGEASAVLIEMCKK